MAFQKNAFKDQKYFPRSPVNESPIIVLGSSLFSEANMGNYKGVVF